ncbi:MAG: hypothetical protein P8M08_06365 [Akkermansiaceae bacterium]|nr:hypothetical protein [Akkermansiaceae bacterium]MDG2323121.1 hypothetical protein [Akkermansiaceae bacterium]
MHKLTHGKVSSLCFGHNLVCQVFIGESKGATESVADKVLRQSPGEIGFTLGYQVA